ncbi:MAG: hypothetical protein FWG87_05540 [Defluviitaleaceae bacterium]|nr:hypothetical protein [Defluviitaleaceae bacterium]
MFRNILLFMLLLVFVSCGSRDSGETETQPEAPSPTEIYTNATTGSALVPDPSASPISQEAPEPAPAVIHELEPWGEAFAEFLANEVYAPYIMLMDFDFDEIPEMVLYAGGGVDTWVYSVVKFADGGIKRLDLDNLMPAAFELYRNRETGEPRWLNVKDGFQTSFERYHHELIWLDFGDFSELRTERFLKWDFMGENYDDDTGEFEWFYYLFDSEGENRTKVDESELGRLIQEFNDTYELETTRAHLAYIQDFYKGTSNSDIYGNLELAPITEFLAGW